MLSSEANEISEKEAKKTIGVEHIEKALRELGFEDYIPEVLESAGQFRELQKVQYKRLPVSRMQSLTRRSQTRERRVNKMEESGYSPEQLAKMQEEMFASAREKYNAGATENGSGAAA